MRGDAGPGAPAKRRRTAGLASGSASDERDPAAGRTSGSAPDRREPDRDPAAVRAFIERFTGLLVLTGFPRTPARIFVALLTSDSSRLTAAELGDLLQASPASISGGARYLIQVGLIAAEGEPGSRRLHYRMPEDVWQDIVQLRRRQFTSWAAELREGVKVLGGQSPAGARMADTVGYFEFISAEMSGLLARWNDRRTTAAGPDA
jgi:DNA-binding transcriptional regulator GbsR (MarR family)